MVEESSAPGYAEPKDGVALSVTDSTTTEAPGKATLSNEPLAVEVTKTDALNGAPLPGVQFKVLDETGEALLFTKTAEGVYRVDQDGIALFQTGPDGKAILLAVPAGDYTLVETGNAGFGKVEPVPFTVTKQNTSQTPVAIGVENQPLALEVYKVDKESQVPLAGVPFKLFNGEGEPLCFALGDDGIYRVSAEGDAIFLTDDMGKATLLYVPEGILNQSMRDTEKLIQLFHISDDQARYITNAQAGSGLLRYAGTLIPFVNRFKKDTELYRLITTKPGEG